jgi:hypothetical protein
MKPHRMLFRSIAAIVMVLGLFILVFPAVTGVRAFHFNHVIATFELRGAHSSAEADALVRTLAASASGMRDTALTQSSWSEAVWVARVQYQATDLRAARQLIRNWIGSTPSPLSLRLIKAAYYPCRLHRPGNADIIFGKPIPLALAD